MNIKTRKKITRGKQLSIKNIYGGAEFERSSYNNIDELSDDENSEIVENVPSENFKYEQDNQSYDFSNCRENISLQPYGDEIKLTLKKNDKLYGLNMNVISFDDSIKETKTFNAKAKIMHEELFIKKYVCKNDGSRIIFDYDKNVKGEMSKQQIVCLELTKDKNIFMSRDTQNVIAYTGNIKLDFDLHTTALLSSKEKMIFLKLKLDEQSTSNGYIWMVVDNYKIEDETIADKSIKIKNENFICGVMPKKGFKLHKLILSLGKSTKEYFTIKGPYTVYRTSNDFSPKQKLMFSKYKTEI